MDKKSLTKNSSKIKLFLFLPFVIASQIWELAKEQTNTMEFAEAIDNSDLESFGFNDDFIFELWGAVTDAKAGRLPLQQQQLQASPFTQEF